MNAEDQAVSDATYHRQLDIFDPSKDNPPVWIIGAGGIGSFSAFALTKLGLRDIHIIDHDKVELHNQPSQLYGLDDVGSHKVESLGLHLGVLAGRTPSTYPVKWEEMNLAHISGIIISAVDSMEVRSRIWDDVSKKPGVQLFLDGRIGGEQIRLYSVNPWSEEERGWYEKTLYTDLEAAKLPCTRASVIDIGFFMAGLVTRAVRVFIKDLNHRFEVIYDVKNLLIL